MKSKTSIPSLTNVFYFDLGRSYHTGTILSLFKLKKLSLEEFVKGCRLIIRRYIDDNQPDLIEELYWAFIEGYKRGESALAEELRIIMQGRAKA